MLNVFYLTPFYPIFPFYFASPLPLFFCLASLFPLFLPPPFSSPLPPPPFPITTAPKVSF